jgi:hypothetical protein
MRAGGTGGVFGNAELRAGEREVGRGGDLDPSTILLARECSFGAAQRTAAPVGF